MNNLNSNNTFSNELIQNNSFSKDNKNFKEHLKEHLKIYYALIRLNINQYLFSKGFFVLLLVCFLPVAIAAKYSVSMYIIPKLKNPGITIPFPAKEFSLAGQVIFRIFYLQVFVYFIAILFGFTMIRKEIDDRTLHYLFLQPIKRYSIVIGKFISYILICWSFICASLILTYFVLLIPWGFNTLSTTLFENRGALYLIQKCFVLLVGLSLYGSIGMVLGSVLKTAHWGFLFFLWEAGVPYLPSSMKTFTIAYYLQSITPEKSAMPPKMFELIGDPPSALFCWITLSAVFLFFFSLSIIIINHYECKYSGI